MLLMNLYSRHFFFFHYHHTISGGACVNDAAAQIAQGKVYTRIYNAFKKKILTYVV